MAYAKFIADEVLVIKELMGSDPEFGECLATRVINSKENLLAYYDDAEGLNGWLKVFRDDDANWLRVKLAFRRSIPGLGKVGNFGVPFILKQVRELAPFFINGSASTSAYEALQASIVVDEATEDPVIEDGDLKEYARLYAEILFILMETSAQVESALKKGPELPPPETVKLKTAKVGSTNKTVPLEKADASVGLFKGFAKAMTGGGGAKDVSKGLHLPTTGKSFYNRGGGESEGEGSGDDNDGLSVSSQSSIDTEEGDDDDVSGLLEQLQKSSHRKGEGDKKEGKKGARKGSGNGLKRAKKEAMLLMAERSNFDPDARMLSITALTRMVHSPKGLTMFALNGARYSVTLVNAMKVSGLKRLLITLISPPFGTKSISMCGERVTARAIFPQSAEQVEVFLSEQQGFLHDTVTIMGKGVSSENLMLVHGMTVQITEFRRKMARLCQTTLLPYPKLHITIFAVILRFMISTWNMAIAHDNIELLTLDFETRFERESKPLLFGCSEGATAQGIAESMAFLQYICPNQQCSAIGSAAEHCFYCGVGVHCSQGGRDSDTINQNDRKAMEAAYQTWRAKQGGSADITRAAHKKTLSSSPSAQPKARKTLTIVSTYAALARDQSIIAPPRAEFYDRA